MNDFIKMYCFVMVVFSMMFFGGFLMNMEAILETAIGDFLVENKTEIYIYIVLYFIMLGIGLRS